MKIETATIRRLRDALLQSGRRPDLIQSSAFETLAREGLLTKEEEAAVARVEPLAETMFLMMAADGVLAEAEQDAFRGAIRGLADNLIHSGTIHVMMERFGERLEAEGKAARLEAIGKAVANEASEKEGAFALAAAVALADDDVDDAENELVNDLARTFGISEARASEILDELEEDREAEDSPV